MRALFGAAFAAAIALGARRARALTPSGTIAAWLVGTCVFGAGGWPYAGVLLAFFVPSTLLTRAGRYRKRALTGIGKGGPRDAVQVSANGGVAAVCALIACLRQSRAASAAFAGAFAAASSDTWATEIGTLAPHAPRSILTLRPVAPGMSGGVTLRGTAAQIAGSVLIGAVAQQLGICEWLPVSVAGVAGSLADSLLGASVQALRYCPSCERQCESNPHACGARTQLVRGIEWMDNDAVNACATALGGVVAAALS